MKHPVILTSSSFPLIHEMGFMTDNNGIEKHPERIMPDINVFVYCLKGYLHVIEDDQNYHLKEGSYLFLRKNVHHWGEHFYQPGSKWFFIHFFSQDISTEKDEYNTYGKTSLVHADAYDKKLTLPKYGEVAHHDYTKLQLQQILEVFESSHPTSSILASMQTHQFFLELYVEKLENYANMKTNRMVTKLIHFMDKEDNHKLTSNEISEEMGMNYAYLSTIFKQQTGKTITQYRNEQIVEKAIHFFRNQNYNVSEVSDKLGFSNPFYFSRVFKKVTGLSPSDYLKRIYRGKR
ncbi:AraC family transcriptional regulator [Gracilibacillus sp. S3-1-1]|uniref:AraC family transcriptional regulator n=1 Tax=Gracilibacillus pellucidus TaxID=3095368 RepID=A0ACC6M995_9BACI|nr:AraC family transcriptional regulator [Gracilibacillus sp. S3-1-1]MDX8047422.1 AraC family transcriptional regulator [Gracilibacillus sp. S3-1-1]